MKSLRVKVELCTGCGSCELTCSKARFKEENREKSAIKVSKKTEGEGYEINVCNQCGKCVEVCPTLALYMNKLCVVMLDKVKCVGCFACIGFCHCLSMRRHVDYLEPFKCVACGMCVKKCPAGALYISEE